MYLNATIEIEPKRLAETAGAEPSEGFDQIADRLSKGLTVEEQVAATRGAIEVLQQVYMTLRAQGITNVVRLAKDDDVAYEDTEGVDHDLKTALRAFMKETKPSDSVVFNTLSLVAEHPGDGLYMLIDVKIRRASQQGRFPVTITVDGLIDELAVKRSADGQPESTEALKARVGEAFDSQDSYEELIAGHRRRFDAFVATLVAGVNEHMDVKTVSEETNVVVVRPDERVGRPSEIPHTTEGDPSFAGHPGFDDRFFYAWQWSELCHERGIHCRNCLIVDKFGADVAQVNEGGFDADESSILDLNAMFAVALGEDVTLFDNNSLVEDRRTVGPGMERVVCPVCWGDKTRFERLLAGFRLERCLSCSMVFVNPQYTEEKLTEIYSVKEDPMKLVDLYAKIHTPEVLDEYEKALDRIEARMPERGRLLDFACAAGYFYERAIARGWEGHGVDLGEWTKIATDKRGVPNMHVGFLKELAFPDGHFDVVNATEVLEHLPQPKEDLAELRRVLREDGLLYITVPNYQCLAILLGRNLFSLNAPPQHINYFTPKTLSLLLEQSGFEVLQMFSGGGLNWENIVGREIESDILDAYRPDAEGGAPPPELAPKAKGASLAKRLIYPAYQRLFNAWGKVGLVLVALARRPPGDYP